MSDLDIERAVDQITEDLRPYVRAAIATRPTYAHDAHCNTAHEAGPTRCPPPTVDRSPVSRCVLDVGTLYASMDAKRGRLGMSWRAVARQLGLSPNTFTRMRGGHPPSADGLCSMVWWMDYGMVGYIRPNPRYLR